MELRVELRIYKSEAGCRIHFWVDELADRRGQRRHVWPEDRFKDAAEARERGGGIVRDHIQETYGVDDYELVVTEPEEEERDAALQN